MNSPTGGMTSSSIPARSWDVAQVEKAPPGRRLTPIRSLPALALEQIE